ncbi:4'-phosphopantetheinyl transferase superfamily protein [Persicobacter sp. CCB-QB2]|uniref:4'-phosphopantetheinyl transferase family protein n=1 Tax=Persicobacter sp. CCB-QB2 TaxID=1561025 RepID=UPI00155DCAB9|nr:4'-phosphopantetheinyl transferase superfamily protein [Persicobacter sp. CCB-QB2]
MNIPHKIQPFNIYRSEKPFGQAYLLSLKLLECKSLLNFKEDILHPEEFEYFNHLVHPKRQLSFLAGRWAVKELLQQFSPLAYSKILIQKGVFQQPVLLHPLLNRWACSISHTDNRLVAMIFPSAHPMGIDCETIQEQMEEKTQGAITYSEKQLAITQGLSNIEGKLWCAKEALSKCLTTGITTPFRIFEISQIEVMEGKYRFLFKNFPQYQVLLWEEEQECMAICLPAESKLSKYLI